MNHEKDLELESLIQANRQAIKNLRSLTEDLAAVVEHEKRLVRDIRPILASPPASSIDKKGSPERARPAPDPGDST
jgi:hypothetical protein